MLRLSEIMMLIVLACATASTATLAQSPLGGGGGGSGGGSGGGGGRHGGGGRGQHGQRSSAAAPDSLPAVHDPWPRLEAGALLCQTEVALQQHQAATIARLNGDDAPEPSGCHLVQRMTAVTIVERHGPARTEIRLTGATPDLGWTDAMMPAQPPVVH